MPRAAASGLQGVAQVLCSRGLSEGHHDWEAEVSNSWVCRGVTYRRSSPLSGRRPGNIVYLLGRNPYSWCLEWDALKFSVWHNNTQTVLHGGDQRSAWRSVVAPAACLSTAWPTAAASATASSPPSWSRCTRWSR